MTARATAGSLSLLVIRAQDIERTRQFYELLGLQFTREKHGSGPEHYAATLRGGTVFEIYPSRRVTPDEGVRLGLRIIGELGVTGKWLDHGGNPLRQVAVDLPELTVLGPSAEPSLHAILGGVEDVDAMFKFLFMSDHARLSGHLERLSQVLGLARLVPFHGSIVDADPAAALRKAAAL